MGPRFSVNDAKQASNGQSVALLVGKYDPPTIDYVRVLEVLSSKYDNIWACPLLSPCPSRARAMTSLLCSEIYLKTGCQITSCLTGLDKNFEQASSLLAWCEGHYPELSFRVVSMDLLLVMGMEEVQVVKFMGESFCKPVLDMSRFIRSKNDLIDSIQSGGNEARSFLPGVWNYIQSKKIYERPKNDGKNKR